MYVFCVLLPYLFLKLNILLAKMIPHGFLFNSTAFFHFTLNVFYTHSLCCTAFLHQWVWFGYQTTNKERFWEHLTLRIERKELFPVSCRSRIVCMKFNINSTTSTFCRFNFSITRFYFVSIKNLPSANVKLIYIYV